jgi:hypothetical protein
VPGVCALPQVRGVRPRRCCPSRSSADGVALSQKSSDSLAGNPLVYFARSAAQLGLA